MFVGVFGTDAQHFFFLAAQRGPENKRRALRSFLLRREAGWRRRPQVAGGELR